MKLSDIMGAANLSVYTEIAMLLFLAAFIAIVIATFAPGRQKTFDAASRMPLDDEHPQTPR
ncbi:MAG: cbb3-type cytochrome c oxidase subunit 3 [Gemmatimonadetes bacterium]|jgi:cbb3-type cytochrome oxidase subunit 3|nr:cbb3-type cytochrome c oxidase subunit 3 [Gemmatimonadota bacterium]